MTTFNPYRAPSEVKQSHLNGTESPVKADRWSAEFGYIYSALKLVAWCYPALILMAIYGTWLVAWIQLGNAPRPMLDDPKNFGVIYTISGCVLICFPAALVAGGSLVAFASREQPAWKRVLKLAIFAGMWALTFYVLRTDPIGVVNWWMD